MTQINFNKIDPSSIGNLVVAAIKDQIWREVDGEVVILNTKSGQYCGLDEVGLRIWELIQQPSKIQVILDTLVGEYDVEHHQCAHDVLALLQEMADNHLIEVKSETSS